jgi:hypothetical protein
MAIQRVLLITPPLRIHRRDHTRLVAAVARAMRLRHLEIRITPRILRIITRPAAAAARVILVLTRPNRPTLRRRTHRLRTSTHPQRRLIPPSRRTHRLRTSIHPQRRLIPPSRRLRTRRLRTSTHLPRLPIPTSHPQSPATAAILSPPRRRPQHR